MPYLDLINVTLALGTLALSVLVVVGIVIQFRNDTETRSHIRQYALPVAFILALFGSALTLFYSEIVGYTPCSLCWLQRVFLYPQVILLGIALYKNDRHIFDYVLALSVLGLIVAAYQYYLQMGGAGIACLGGEAGSDCARRYVLEFGFITFPFMSLVSFAFLTTLYTLARKSSQLLR